MKEVEEHFLTHVPCRSWYPHCVRRKGPPESLELKEDRRIREFSLDYSFLGDENGAKITVLVGRERVTGMTMAIVVLVAGTSGQFAAVKALEFVKECGAVETEITLKSDQEPAMARGAAITVLGTSPVGSSGSNGVVERSAGRRRLDQDTLVSS